MGYWIRACYARKLRHWAKARRKENKGSGKGGGKRADGDEEVSSKVDNKFLGSLGVLAFDLYARIAMLEFSFSLKTVGGYARSPFTSSVALLATSANFSRRRRGLQRRRPT